MAQLPSQSQFGDYGEWPGRDVLDSGGERLGGVREIYLDRETGRPEWVLVDIPDDEARFVPLADASVESSRIRVAHTAAAIRSAPGIGSEPRIDQSEERRLYDHYGLGYSESDSGSGLPDAADPWGADEPKPDPWKAEAEKPADDDPWQTYQGRAVTPPTESSWSAAAEEEPTNLAPPPAEPPTPAELERADILEPPAASERAFEDFTATTEPAAPEPAAAAPEPAAAPIAPTTAGEILAATPEAEDLKAQPGPDAVRATEPPRIHQVPPPPPEPEAGPLETVSARKNQIAIGAAVALVLLFLLRKRR
jgi:hypothetical protein